MPDYSEYMPPLPDESYIPSELEEVELQPKAEVKEYILGKSSKAKEKLVKIKDLTANDGRVTLEGRLINSEVRETRFWKGNGHI